MSAGSPAPTLELLASVLAWAGGPLPAPALRAHLPDLDATATRAVERGWVLRDAAGWLAPNPLRAPAPGHGAGPSPRDQDRARRVVEAALAAHPDRPGLQVAWLRTLGVGTVPTPGQRAAVRDRFSAFVAKASFGLCAGPLRHAVEDAGLLPPLLETHRAPTLRLLIEGGRVPLARSVLQDTDGLAHAVLALHAGEPERALARLASAGSMEAAFTRIRAHRLRHDWSSVRHEVDALTPRVSTDFDRLRLAYYRHNCARLLGGARDRAATRGALRAALEAVPDQALRGRALDALISGAVLDGRISEGRALLTEMSAAFSPLDAPDATAQVSYRAIEIAAEVGDHAWLQARLARPSEGGLDAQWHRILRARWLSLTGGFKEALEIPEVQGIGLLAAQFLSGTGRLEEALARADGPTTGFPTRYGQAIRGLIAAPLGRAQRTEPHPDDTPRVRSLVHQVNGHVALGEDAIAEAEDHFGRALDIAEDHHLLLSVGTLLPRLADIAARTGRTAEALALLDRFDRLGRHPHDLSVNLAAAGRAVLLRSAAGLPPGFVDRLVAQGDVRALAVVQAITDIGPAGIAQLAALPDHPRACFTAAFQPGTTTPTLHLDLQERAAVLPDGARMPMKRAGASWRVLIALAEHRQAAPGGALDPDALIEAGWPGEQIQWEAARTRLYTTMRRLRSRGFTALETVDGGYRLSTRWRVEVA